MKSYSSMEYNKIMKNGPMQSYPNENFDKVTQLACQIADLRRETGRKEPAFGYAKEDWNEAHGIVYNPKREV